MHVGWDISHRGFTIRDYYYFSKLASLLESLNIKVHEIDELSNLNSYDVLVFNYPEEPFDEKEKKLLHDYLLDGGRIILLGYFRNEDRVADSVNSLARRYGIELLHDEVIDKINSLDEEGYFITTTRLKEYNWGVRKVVLPCSASIKVKDASSYPIVYAENTAFSKLNGYGPPLFVAKKVGKGEIIVGGTCVFWDNYSIDKFDNAKLALNIIAGKDLSISRIPIKIKLPANH
ncbi:MAG: DUF4350 domain-containing protein [Candidatus Njordarchaeales archaeon]